MNGHWQCAPMHLNSLSSAGGATNSGTEPYLGASLCKKLLMLVMKAGKHRPHTTRGVWLWSEPQSESRSSSTLHERYRKYLTELFVRVRKPLSMNKHLGDAKKNIARQK